MICLLKPGTYSTYMKLLKCTRDSWNNLIANPMVIDDKFKAPLLIWGTLSETVEVDTDYGYPRCIGDNIKNIKALQVDIDNGCPIEEFQKKYSKYSYQLYTSYNYGFKEGDRYRAIFPLEDAFEMRYLCPPVKQALISVFPDVDQTCFDKGHWQIVPAVRSKDAPYKYIQHEGETLDLLELTEYTKLYNEYQWDIGMRKSLREMEQKPTHSSHEGALRKAQEVIDAAVPGTRNSEYFKILNWLHGTVEADEDEAYSLDFPMDMYNEAHAMISRIWNGR